MHEGADYYADVLEGRGFGPDWYARVEGGDLLDGGQDGLLADGKKVVVDVRVDAGQIELAESLPRLTLR